ncbi:MAG TPA: hypothetical protein PK095_00940 [Myxococcota bacterium]|nr:hypothetical protein [Myxococcota bacterium]
MPPIAHAGTAPAPIPFVALPVDIPLNGSASTPGVGATEILEWEWQLRSKPTGSSASLPGTSTPNPTLSGVDRAGANVIWLRVRNDVGEWSAPDTDAAFHEAWISMPSSIVIIDVALRHSGLLIPGEGEHAYKAKYEALYGEVDRLRGQMNIVGGGTEPVPALYVDNVYEATEGHQILFHDIAVMQPGVALWFRNQTEAIEEVAYLMGGVDGGNGLEVVAPRGIEFRTDQGGLRFLGGENKNAYMDYDLTFADERWLRVNSLQPAYNDTGVRVQGRGTHVADLLTNAIGEDTLDAGVTIDGVLVKDSGLVASGPILVDTLQHRVSLLRLVGSTVGVQVNASDSQWAALGGLLDFGYGSAPTTGTAVETMYELVADVGAFRRNGCGIVIQSWWLAAANPNSKGIAVYINDVLVGTGLTVETAERVRFGATIVRSATNTLEVVYDFHASGQAPKYEGPLTVVASTSSAVNIKLRAHTPMQAGDLTFLGRRVSYEGAQ